MAFLEKLGEHILNSIFPIINMVKQLINGIEFLGEFIDHFEYVDQVTPLVESFFPQTFMTAFTALLSVYVGVRILRFLTLQG